MADETKPDETERTCLRPKCGKKFKGDECPACKHVRNSPCSCCGYFEVAPIVGSQKPLLQCPDCKEVFQERTEPGKPREFAAWEDIPEAIQETIPRHRQKARGMSKFVGGKKA